MITFLFLVSIIDVDFRIVRDTNLVPYIVVHYKIPFSEISFFKKDSIYEAQYSSAIIIKRDNQQIGGNSVRRKIETDNYLKTISPNQFSVCSLKQKLSSGEYKIIFNTWDLQSSKRWSWEKDISVSEMAALDIGTINWIGGPSREITTKDTVKIKMRIYDTYRQGAYLEYYFRSANDIIYFINDTLISGSKEHVINIKHPANLFPENHYKFIVHLRDIRGKEIQKRELDFEIQEPFFSSYRYLERVKQLVYIATSKEMEQLQNARVDKREEIWNEFWRKRDPTSGDEVNEFRDEYFSKVNYAQEHFSTGLTEGWKSDRGKIYIILGPPDYIERYPFEMERKAYQIWYYYNRGYRLVFVERYNLGEYELINPPRGIL
jgi:GWxTD domain-containing protein